MNIKLLSYNIQSWDVNDRRIKGILDLIRRHNPDVICFQEVTLFWYSLLKKELSNAYAFTGRDRFYNDKVEPKRHFERNCVAYKKDRFKAIKTRTFWLGPDMYNPSKFEGASLNRVFTIAVLLDKKTNKKTQVISTHFDNCSPEIREKQGKVLTNYLKTQHSPLILMGDFNSEPYEKAYQLIKNVLVDVGEECGETNFTYHGYEKYSPMRIDFFYKTPDVKVESFELVKDKFEGLPPSDHYPVKAIIDF